MVVKLKTKFGRAYIGNHGYYVVTSKKEGNHNKLLHRLIFEDVHKCTILDGVHVHHIDGNKTNNNSNNLELKYAFDHHRDHSTGNRHLLKDRKKMSEKKKGRSNPQSQTGYYRVHKENGKQYSKGFIWTYSVHESRIKETGHKIIYRCRRTSLKTLRDQVIKDGYEWKVVDQNKACASNVIENFSKNFIKYCKTKGYKTTQRIDIWCKENNIFDILV